MNDEIDQRFKTREKRVRAHVQSLDTLALIPLAASALKRMKPAQLRLARKMTLEELAGIEEWQKEFTGF